MNSSRFTYLILATMLAACGGDGPTGPGGGSGPFSASIGGVAWQTDEIALGVTSGGAVTPGSLIISGTQVQTGSSNYRSLILVLGFVTGPGTYPLGVNNGTTAGGTGTVVVVDGGTVTNYLTPFSGDAGSVTITSLGSNAVGTFEFTAPPLLGGGANQVVTDGSFDVPLPASFVAATNAGRGSTMTATSLGGAAWNGATIVGVGTAASFAISATTDTYSLTLTPLTTPAINTAYAVPAQIQILVSQVATINGWGGALSTGTVTFTALGPRVIGTFNGTLAPVGATVGSIVIIGGTFDVKLP
jgi:hypothetical protein